MNEEFQLPVSYKGKDLLLPARLLKLGYIYKIEVEIYGNLIVFDRDEERNWRAIIKDPATSIDPSIDNDLIRSIVTALEETTNS